MDEVAVILGSMRLNRLLILFRIAKCS